MVKAIHPIRVEINFELLQSKIEELPQYVKNEGIKFSQERSRRLANRVVLDAYTLPNR